MLGLDCLTDRKVINILRWVFSQREAITGNQIAKVLGVASNTATKYCEQLVADGIFTKRVIGKAYCYELKSSYITNDILAPLFQKEAMIQSIIEKKIRLSLRGFLVSAISYGTGSQGVVSEDRTYCLCCVTNEHSDELTKRLTLLEHYLSDEFHLSLDVTVITLDELEQKKDLPFYQKLLENGVNLLEA